MAFCKKLTALLAASALMIGAAAPAMAADTLNAPLTLE